MEETTSSKSVVSTFFLRLSQRYQLLLDKSTPHTKARWIGAFINLGLFLTRIITAQGCEDLASGWNHPSVIPMWYCLSTHSALVQYDRAYSAGRHKGWYIVTYALGIYHLNLFIAFLTPKIDPALDLDSDDPDGPALPTRSNEEFRPFIRRLPEFKFWYAITKSTTIALICTFFEVFNVPVFWPILVMYFITLFCITMKRQIRHMIKHRYLPFTHSKPKYQTAEVTIK